jgi:putative DNA primase/helicase
VDALISGEPLTIDRKYRDAELYSSVAKVIWAMNDKPRIGNTTSGIFRRVKVVEFPKLGRPANPRVKEAVKGEGAGILNWALEGLARLHDRGHLQIPDSVRAATEEFEKSNDLPAMFVEEDCIVGPSHEIAAGILYDNYAEWARSNGHKPQSSTRLADDWRRLGFERKVVKGRKYWVGLRIKGSGL